MEERSKLQKAVLISMAAMVVLFGVLMVAARFQKGVEFEGGLLRRTETEESVIYNGKVRGGAGGDHRAGRRERKPDGGGLPDRKPHPR